MIETIVISILGVLVVVLGFTTFNLLRKNEKQEDILTSYMEYLDQVSKTIEFYIYIITHHYLLMRKYL